MPDVHPGLVLIAGGLLLSLLRGRLRSAVALVVPLVSLLLVWTVADGTIWIGNLAGFTTVPFAVDRLSRLFATIFALMTFGGALFGLNQSSRLEMPAAFVYAGSALGVTFAGDLLTLFVFWELMAIGSTLVMWSAGSPSSYRASLRYLMIHLIGGVLLMVGIAGHVLETGSLQFVAMSPHGIAHWFILAAFLINAGAPPLSAWLPDVYPEASWSGMVFLSAFTTKIAVYALIRGFPGAEPLVYIGLYMVFYGIIYALLENDMRRILAYSIVNQVGFMVTAIGIGTEMALNGAAAHAFTHILYKGLLIMSAGSVLYMTGRRKCTDLGGLFQSMPLTALCGIVGALAISAFPLTSGFVSKALTIQAAVDEHLFLVWILLVAASAGVFLHAGIKFPWFVFFQKNSGLRPPDPPLNMRLAMLFFAGLCIGLGIFYQPLYRLLPFPVAFEPYTGAHVVTQLQLLLFSGLAFFVMLGWLRRTLTITLDFDWLYRAFLPTVASRVEARFVSMRSSIIECALRSVARLFGAVQRWHGPHGIVARTDHAGSTAMWMLGLLGTLMALLLIGYLT
ncbi:MAG: Na(+)/H(+) antiporter subunit D [Casimicrobiaceae bacterium]